MSVDASVGISADDRAALERVPRYCARPCWASERLTQADDGERLIYAFDKPRPDGSWQLTLTPLELLDRLARFIPPPRRHLHRYHGVFAPHAALRAQVAARTGEAIAALVAPTIAQSATSAPTAPDAPAAAGNLAEAIRAELGLAACRTFLASAPEALLALRFGDRSDHINASTHYRVRFRQKVVRPFGLRVWTSSAALRRLPMEEPLAARRALQASAQPHNASHVESPTGC